MVIDPPVTGDTSKLAIEESRRLIDEQKVELYELIRQLNSRRNHLAPISILPPELLGRIFTFVITKGTQHFTSLLESLSFTYVSQNWRNVALETPDLWDTPAFCHPTWARAMLERSKMVDLVINSNIPLTTYRALMNIKEVFDNHAARVREIDLHEINSSFLSSILENVQSSSLRLRSLQLTTYDEWAEDNPRFPLFPAHLLARPDGLQRLVINGCAFDLYAQPRPVLTHLSMERPRDRPLLSEFVTALSAMPGLETLRMVQSLPLATKPVKLGLKVELPNLSFLHLSSTENFLEVLNVVDFLIVPGTARVNLLCAETTPQPNEPVIQLPDIVSPLDHFFSCMTGNERRFYKRLRLYDSTYDLGLTAWKTERPQDGMSTDLPDLDMSLNPFVYRKSHFVDEVLRCVTPFHLQALFIDTSRGQDAIHSFFGQSTTILTLGFQFKTVVREFLQALTHKPEGYEHLESSYYSVTFPALQSLKFNQTVFDDDTLRQFFDCLMERYERGAELQKLSICKCYNIDDESIRLLREIVPDVEWDGNILAEYDDYSSDSQDSTDYP